MVLEATGEETGYRHPHNGRIAIEMKLFPFLKAPIEGLLGLPRPMDRLYHLGSDWASTDGKQLLAA